ncbi:MAG: peroxiredoxin [Betaproteobacteria bacterium]|nr:peroxiredoxin [Betaproteobacteria bacterium]
MKKHQVIVCWMANPDHPQQCVAPFFHAAAAAAMDVEVEVYFISSAVLLLKRGVAEKLMSGPQARENVYAFMRQAAQHGAKFYACSQALSEHHLSLADLVPETSGAAGAAAYVARSLEDGWSLVVY